MNVARKDGFRNYTAQGAYGMIRTLLIGSQYTYSHADAGVATRPKAHLNSCWATTTQTRLIQGRNQGGIMNDINCTFNYYINSWMLARLRYSYSTVRNRDVGNLLPKRP